MKSVSCYRRFIYIFYYCSAFHSLYICSYRHLTVGCMESKSQSDNALHCGRAPNLLRAPFYATFFIMCLLFIQGKSYKSKFPVFILDIYLEVLSANHVCVEKFMFLFCFDYLLLIFICKFLCFCVFAGCFSHKARNSGQQ